MKAVRGERGYEEEGEFVDNMKQGIWRMFSLEGDLMAIENYRWGQKDGKNVYFNHLGQLLREESWRAIDPKNPYDTVSVYDVNDPTKVVGTQIIKLETLTVKHGVWKFYDPYKNMLETTETWYMDRPGKKDGDDLLPIEVSDTSDDALADSDKEKKKVPKPKEVVEFEKKNAGKKKIKVRTGSDRRIILLLFYLVVTNQHIIKIFTEE